MFFRRENSPDDDSLSGHLSAPTSSSVSAVSSRPSSPGALSHVLAPRSTPTVHNMSWPARHKGQILPFVPSSPRGTDSWKRTHQRVAEASSTVLGSSVDETCSVDNAILRVEGQSTQGLLETSRTLLRLIWNVLQLIEINRPACASLVERCASALLAVRQEIADIGEGAEHTVDAPLTKLVESFVLVHSYLQIHCQHQPLEQYLPRSADRRALHACDNAVDEALKLFDRKIQLRTVKLMLSAELKRRKDTEDEVESVLRPTKGTLQPSRNSRRLSLATGEILTPPPTDNSEPPSRDSLLTDSSEAWVDSPHDLSSEEFALKELVELAIQPRDAGATQILKKVPSHGTFKVWVDELGLEEVKAAVERLDWFLDSLSENDSYLRRLSFAVLRSLCIKHNAYPESFILDATSVRKHSDHPEALGGSAQVWRGDYNGRNVGIKVFPVASRDSMDPRVLKTFCKEAVVWKYLRHPNITPFYGVNTTLFPLCFVCEWMTRGTIMGYLRQRPGANRIKLLIDIAEGLAYLHDMGVLHGDLKGANILINESHDACISDFGLAALSHDSQMSFMTETSVAAGSTRWMPPEILDPEQFGLERSHLSKQSDIYSFSMVMWEVFTGLVPFHQYARDPTVINKIMSGSRPSRLQAAAALGLCDALWTLMAQCWSESWQERPAVAILLDQLHRQMSEVYEHPMHWPLLDV